MAPGPGLDQDVDHYLKSLLRRKRSYTDGRPGTLLCENGRLLLGVWLRHDNAYCRGRVWKGDR